MIDYKHHKEELERILKNYFKKNLDESLKEIALYLDYHETRKIKKRKGGTQTVFSTKNPIYNGFV